MPQPLQILRLTPTDADRLRQLNAMFGEAFDDAETYGGAPPDEAYVRKVVGREHVIVLVAVQNDVVVGGLVAYELDKLERARSEIYLYDLAVAAPQRRQGIATQLIARLRAIAHERGAWVVYVQADRGDGPALSLYAQLGTREDVFHFDLPVP